MLKLEFTLEHGSDLRQAGALLARLGEAMRGETVTATGAAEQPAPAVTRKPRTPKPDPVEQYVAAGGTMPASEVSNMESAPVAEQPTPTTTPTPAPEQPAVPVDLDSQRAQLRDKIKRVGMLWCSQMLARNNVAKLSELDAVQLAAALAEADPVTDPLS